jgi:hypothetical protein
MAGDAFLSIGHRGARGHAPENTLLSIDTGIGLGAGMVEFDVQRHPSGALLVIHDLRLDRTTNGNGRIVDRSFDYIRSLDGRFSSLSGDVVATGASGDTLNLTLREGGPMPHQPDAGQGWQWWAIATIAVGVLAVLGVAAALLIRRRRRTTA